MPWYWLKNIYILRNGLIFAWYKSFMNSHRFKNHFEAEKQTTYSNTKANYESNHLDKKLRNINSNRWNWKTKKRKRKNYKTLEIGFKKSLLSKTAKVRIKALSRMQKLPHCKLKATIQHIHANQIQECQTLFSYGRFKLDMISLYKPVCKIIPNRYWR